MTRSYLAHGERNSAILLRYGAYFSPASTNTPTLRRSVLPTLTEHFCYLLDMQLLHTLYSTPLLKAMLALCLKEIKESICLSSQPERIMEALCFQTNLH